MTQRVGQMERGQKALTDMGGFRGTHLEKKGMRSSAAGILAIQAEKAGEGGWGNEPWERRTRQAGAASMRGSFLADLLACFTLF